MSTPTPAELIAQWRPRLRRIAFQTNNELADVLQEAWLLAATMRRGEAGEAFVQRWLVAVERHARRMAPGFVCEEAAEREWAGGGDPALVLEGAEAVAGRLGDALEAAIAMPHTTREIAAALGKSQRQARRIKQKLAAWAAVHGDLFAEVVV